MKFILILLASMLLYMSCDKNIGSAIDTEASSIVGRWTLTEAFISSGGPQYWTDVEDGEEITFFKNGTFSSNRFAECSKGNFLLVENELILQYDCEGFTTESANEEGMITYSLELFPNYFLATPTCGPICFEGCSYKYKS